MLRYITAVLAAASLGVIVPRYVAMGFGHILPHGLDHILFILGLFFLARDAFTLLVQVTLFTMAHSLSLGLALYDVVRAPQHWVEVAIALSIAFVAVENLFSDRLSRWRPWMVFGFGLIHGLGFAHTFQSTPVSVADLLPALFSYNVGIELGQLTVIAVVGGLAALAWNRDWYASHVARPASLLIAATGMYWAIERAI